MLFLPVLLVGVLHVWGSFAYVLAIALDGRGIGVI